MQRPMPAVPVVVAERRARLHRVDDDAVVAQLETGDVRGRRESRSVRVGVAEMEVEPAVARHLVVELRRAGSQRLLRLGHRGQGFDIETDRFGGVARGGGRLGDDDGDGIADIAHLVAGERVAGRLPHRRAVAVLERRDDLQRPVAGFGEIGGGVDASTPGIVPCRAVSMPRITPCA